MKTEIVKNLYEAEKKMVQTACKELSERVNSFGYDTLWYRNADDMSGLKKDDNGTLHRLFKTFIWLMAKKTERYQYDDRNKMAVEKCQKIVDYFGEEFFGMNHYNKYAINYLRNYSAEGGYIPEKIYEDYLGELPISADFIAAHMSNLHRTLQQTFAKTAIAFMLEYYPEVKEVCENYRLPMI